jgi:hypothetical protein
MGEKENATQIQHQLAEFFNACSQSHLSILLPGRKRLTKKNSAVGRFQRQATTIGAPQVVGIGKSMGGEKIDGFYSRALVPHRTGHDMRPGKRHSIPRAFADSNRPDKRSKQK